MANAYTEAWKPWDDRMANHVLAKRNWQLAFGAVSLIAFALTICVIYLSARIRYVIYAVAVDKMGYALAQGQPLTPQTGPAAEMLTRMERFEVAEYIRQARTVSDDVNVQHEELNAVLAHTVRQSAADQFLNDYYHQPEHNPFVRAQKAIVTVQIDSILPVSRTTWEVRWHEETRNPQGVLQGTPTNWEAQLKTQLVPPKDADSIVSNPIGFFVNSITWTEAQQ